jgi:hypothetical protein
MGTEENAIPWNKLTYDTSLGGYRTAIPEQQLRGAPAYPREQTTPKALLGSISEPLAIRFRGRSRDSFRRPRVGAQCSGWLK